MKTIKVGAAIIERDGKYLIAKRPEEKSFGGMWEFPGGKIEDGESDEGCLYREIKEEFPELIIFISEFFEKGEHEDENLGIRIELFGYLAMHLFGNAIPVEHSSVKWVSPAEIENHNFAPADIPLVEKLKALHAN